MLQKEHKYAPHYTLSCDDCRKASEDLPMAATFEVARATALAKGWCDTARKNTRIEKRAWSCPACNPANKPPSSAFGTGLSHLMPERK